MGCRCWCAWARRRVTPYTTLDIDLSLRAGQLFCAMSCHRMELVQHERAGGQRGRRVRNARYYSEVVGANELVQMCVADFCWLWHGCECISCPMVSVIGQLACYAHGRSNASSAGDGRMHNICASRDSSETQSTTTHLHRRKIMRCLRFAQSGIPTHRDCPESTST